MAKKELTVEQKRKLLLTPCKTKKEVKAWVKYFLNLDLPDVTVSRHANTNPLDTVWEMYRICVLKQNPENIQELLYTASRGAGKTLGTAVAEFMILLHDQRDIAHVGAIMAQAKRAYEYIQGFCLSPNVKPIVDPPDASDGQKILQKSTMEKSIFNINGQTCTMEILPTTMKALNGLHVSLVSTDELDTLSGESLRAIKEVAGMLDTKKGKKPLRVGISTRKSKYGLMNKMIENADQEGRHLRFWTALEFTERCPDTRSGVIPTNYWINVEQGEVLSEEDYSKKDQNKKKDYFLETTMFDKCKTCPAAVFCRGDAKKQISKSNMLKSIDELNQKIRSEGFDWASSQLFNLKPSTEGIIFREYDEKIHVKDWNQLWFTLTGKEFPGVCTHDMFVKKCHELQLPCFGGIDWGYSAPHTVVYFFMDKKENVYVVKCDGMTYISQPMWIHHIKTKYHNLYRCQLYVPDSADQGAILEMQKSGLPTSNNQKDKGSVNSGIQVIKKLLKVPGTMEAKIFFAKETCAPILNELSLYHYKLDAAGIVTDDPDSEHDHWVDALRYALMHLLGKSQLILGSGLSFDNSEGIVDRAGNYTRMPSPTEFAALSGIKINENDQDLSKLGKIGLKDNLDTPDDDDNSSGGGFLWSF